jgi:hypothetical protein
MIARINAKPEKALREALTSVARIEAEQIPPSLAALDDGERAETLGLAIIITCYVLVDACGSQWPVQSSPVQSSPVQRPANCRSSGGRHDSRRADAPGR